MKKLIGIICISGILLQHLAPVCILLGFQWHRDEIAKTLCINRKKPGSCCKGKCYLEKSLKKEATKEKKQSVKENIESVWIILSDEAAMALTVEKNIFQTFSIKELPELQYAPLPHPPSLIG